MNLHELELIKTRVKPKEEWKCLNPDYVKNIREEVKNNPLITK
jgi:hypothetical protein